MDTEIEKGIYGFMNILEQQSKSYIRLQYVIVVLLGLLLLIAINIWQKYPYEKYSYEKYPYENDNYRNKQ
jgi:hypothetical protein